MADNTFKIAIIGAGPAGSLLANLLLKLGPSKAKLDVTVFESAEFFTSKGQGGSLDLDVDTGIFALKKAGLFDEFLRYARYDGDSMLICDRNLTPFLRTTADPKRMNSQHARPEIDRARLRQILIESLPDGTIKWGHKLKSVSDDRTLHFDNGNTAGDFDLIVGADGAWSHVRAFLAPGPENEPIYCGYEGNCWLITDAEKRAPDVYKMVNKGMCMVAFDHRALTAQALGDGGIWVYAMKSREPELPSSVHRERKKKSVAPKTPADVDALRNATLDMFSDYHPALRRIMEATDQYCNDIAYFCAPEGFRWASNPRVTMIGDAAHLMTPKAGQGVNLAMTDALDLTDTIERILNIDSNDVTAIKEHALLIQQFENQMCQRAAPTCRVSVENAHDMYPFADDKEPSAKKMKRFLNRVAVNRMRPKFPWSWWIVRPVILLSLIVIYDFGLHKWLYKA